MFSLFAATRSINTNGPEPPLQFDHDLPPYILVNSSKGAVFLDCVVTVKGKCLNDGFKHEKEC